MSLETALIHRVRAIGFSRGLPRNSQGEYPRRRQVGPWAPARVMIRGAVAPKARQPAGSTEAHAVRGYELLLGVRDEDGGLLEAPTASTVFETDCGVLGSPTVELNGEPEPLTNGSELFGWLCYGDVPLERS